MLYCVIYVTVNKGRKTNVVAFYKNKIKTRGRIAELKGCVFIYTDRLADDLTAQGLVVMMAQLIAKSLRLCTAESYHC